MIRHRPPWSRRACALFVAFAATWVLCGCATYTRTIREAQIDLTAGRPASALGIINDRLDVDEASHLPAELDENQVLLLLERATLLQAIGNYELAARDMMIADQRLDWLDIDGATSVDLGKYLYSGASTPYRAPAYERLLLNTLNMLNFMAMRDFQGARVEARRFRLIEQFVLGEDDGDPLTAGLLAAGNYLSGVAFEASREYDIAVRHFGRAWVYGHRTEELRERLVDLARVTGWDGAGVTATTIGPVASSGTLAELLEAAKVAGAMRPAQYRRRHVDGQILAVVQTGLAPYKVPQRIPIGQALAWSSHHRGRHGLDPAQRHHATQLAVSGALKWINFPMLTSSGLPQPSMVGLEVDDHQVPLAQLVNVAEQVERGYQSIAGALIGAAILRMIVRAAAGGATRVGSEVVAQNRDAPAIGALGWLAGAAIEGAMAAADVPDTRSWTTAPAFLQIARIPAGAGLHRVVLTVDGETDDRYVRAREEGLTVVNFSRLR